MIRPSFLRNGIMTVKDYIVELIAFSSFSCFLRRAGRFILRLRRWIPVLWKQEEWDYEFIYDHIELKMKELRDNMSKDVWHDQKEVRKGIKQIDICLQRLDRWRDWPKYYDYPMGDIACEEVEGGFLKPVSTNPENEKQRLGAVVFEQKNYDKFWKDFLAWHRGWWT